MSLAPPEGLTPAQAAREAALARLTLPPQDSRPSDPSSSHSTLTPFTPSAQDKLPFHRLLDSDVLPSTSKAQAVKSLSTLHQLISNILDPPNPAQAAKYRQVRLNNKSIERDIMNVKGAHDYLVAAGFRRSTVEFTPYLTFTPSPTPKQLHALKTSQVVLDVVLTRAKAAEEREGRFREAEKEVEKGRKEKALLGFEEDRRLKREKDERDKLVREARAAMPSSDPLLASTRTDASTMSLSRDSDDEEDDDEDAPPSYGTLHGRVLGTGEPVGGTRLEERGVRMVHQQDEE